MEPVTAIATVPAVLALVTLAKDLGLPSRIAPLLAIVLGVVLTVLQAAAMNGGLTTADIFTVISSGVILGLSASGLYDGAKLVGNAVNPKVGE